VGLIVVGIVVLVLLLFVGVPELISLLNTVSTDDAYVNGHDTLVAPRVLGQVARVLVDDNNRVRKGDLLVELDKEPYQVQLNIAQAAVDAAQANLVATIAQVRAQEAQARSTRFNLEHAVEDVDNQVALLQSRVATLASQQATLNKSRDDYQRGLPLVSSGAISSEEIDRRKEAVEVAQAQVDEAMQGVNQVRVSLGLAPKAGGDSNLSEVPPDLDQTFSTVREAQYTLYQAAAQLGVSEPFGLSPKQMIAEFYKRDPQGNIDRIYAQILKDAPAVKVAQTKLLQADRDLDQAKLNLRYCDVVAEIDGVISRREVNPGDNVVVGQSLMSLRSLTDIWIDANFKETQLADLRIGQPVDLYLDTYGRHYVFKGRVSGFTIGTGSTLALLPAENATGNFVKVVQRLPVRIDLVDYDPEKKPLFVGLSVTPYVHIHEEPTGPAAGAMLQPYVAEAPTALPQTPATTEPGIGPGAGQTGMTPAGGESGATWDAGTPGVGTATAGSAGGAAGGSGAGGAGTQP
jgi:membrane fusion protein (multidrug efflux system)